MKITDASQRRDHKGTLVPLEEGSKGRAPMVLHYSMPLRGILERSSPYLKRKYNW